MVKTICSIFIILLLSSLISFGQEGIFDIRTGEKISESELTRVLPDSFELFGPDEPLVVSVESDFKNLVKRKYKDEYQAAILHFQLNDTAVAKREIRIKPRGEFRKRYCHFPPIKLNFKKTEFLTSSVQDLEKMKMVTHCKFSKTYESYILKEYLVYKLFNLLTDKSFEARLLKVRYIDTGRKNKTSESFAFVIEQAKKMAKRHNAIIMDQKKLSQPHMQSKHMTLVAMFEFMIGNTDWSVPGPHNLKLVKILELNEPDPYPVPYDFDYCGLVDAEYAIPTEGLNIKDVKTRLFQGFCRTDAEYQEVVDIFMEKEQAMYDLVNNFPFLNKYEKREITNYLGDFFRLAKRSNSFFSYLNNTCKN